MTTEATPGTTAGGTPNGAGTTVDGSALSDQDKQELEALRRQKEQWLGERTKYEEAQRALEAAAVTPPPTGDMDALAAQKFAELQYRAQNGDTDAAFQLRTLQATAQSLAQMQQQMAMSAIPADKHQAVRQIMQERGVDPITAFELVRGRELQERQRQIENQEANLKAADERRRMGILDVTVRPASPTEGSPTQKLRLSEWLSQVENAKARGDTQEVLRLARRRDTEGLLPG